MIYRCIFYGGYEIYPFQYRKGFLVRKNNENIIEVKTLAQALQIIDYFRKFSIA